MSFSAKKFLKQYGSAGVIAYGGVTMLSVTSIYLGLRTGVDIIVPLEKCLGSDSEFVQNIKAKLAEPIQIPPSFGDNGSDDNINSTTTNDNNINSTTNDNNNNNNNNSNNNNNNRPHQINWVREGTYFGIAGALDSFVLPLKLVICLPLARQILKIRGRRRP